MYDAPAVPGFRAGIAPTVSGKCEECGGDFNMGGPFWTEPIHDEAYCERLLHKLEREKADFPAYGKVQHPEPFKCIYS